MDTWIFIAATAYFLNAVAFVIDKYLLALPIPKPFTYAVWVAMLSTPVVLLIPFFDIFIPSVVYFAISFASGTAFFVGLILLYKAIQKSDVSVASTQAGVLTSVFTYLFSFFILGTALPQQNAIAIGLLILGMLFLGSVGKGIVLHAIGAGALLALSFVLLKWTFTAGDFVNGVFWTRIGFIGSAVISLVISRRARNEVKTLAKKTTGSSKTVFVINKLIAGTAFVLLYYAILLGNVVIINALLGLQFLFVFLLAIALRNKLRGIEENMERKALAIKSVGIALVLSGFLAILI